MLGKLCIKSLNRWQKLFFIFKIEIYNMKNHVQLNRINVDFKRIDGAIVEYPSIFFKPKNNCGCWLRGEFS